MENEALINKYLTYLKESPTPYQVVQNSSEILIKKGFKKLKDFDEIKIKSGRYFVVLHDTLLIAFTIPKITKNKIPAKIIATHSDSPVLKLKPNGISKTSNYASLQPYGGGLWHTWFDRPLSAAGKIIFDDLSHNIIKHNDPLFYIPSLPIHLNSQDVYKNGFLYNKEKHLRALFANEPGSCILSQLIFDSQNDRICNNTKVIQNFDQNKKIISHDISLYDIQEPILGGYDKKFIFSARQDNLLSSFCALEAILNVKDFHSSLNIIAIFDHEEIGSETVTGAESELINDFIKKFNDIIDKNESMIISADVAHGYNHNYSEKYDDLHKPILGKGIVIKHSIRYATNAKTAAIVRFLMENKNVQDFCLKNDMVGGSTIGPMLCAGTGIKGVDIGAPVLGMHSIKEVSHCDDIFSNISLFENFFMKKIP